MKDEQGGFMCQETDRSFSCCPVMKRHQEEGSSLGFVLFFFFLLREVYCNCLMCGMNVVSVMRLWCVCVCVCVCVCGRGCEACGPGCLGGLADETVVCVCLHCSVHLQIYAW